jgi:hypothetical protein
VKYAVAIASLTALAIAGYLLWREYQRRQTQERILRAVPSSLLTGQAESLKRALESRTSIDPIDPSLIGGDFSALGPTGMSA